MNKKHWIGLKYCEAIDKCTIYNDPYIMLIYVSLLIVSFINSQNYKIEYGLRLGCWVYTNLRKNVIYGSNWSVDILYKELSKL